MQQTRKFYAGALIVWVSLLGLQSCSGNKVATECYELQEALIAEAMPFPQAGTVTKAIIMAEAEHQSTLADTLAAVDISDQELAARRDQIVSLNRQLYELRLQAADITAEDGTWLGDSARHSELSDQRKAINDQLFAEQNGLRIFCSLQ